MLLLVVSNLGHWPTINVRTVVMFGLVSFTLIGAGRYFLRLNLRRLRRRGHNVKTLLLVGGGARGRSFAARITLRQDLGYRVLGYVDSDPAFEGKSMAGAPWMGTIDDLPRILTKEVIDKVPIPHPIQAHDSKSRGAVHMLEEQVITTSVLPDT